MSYSGIKDIYNGVGLKFMVPIATFLQSVTTNPALLYHFLTFVIEFSGIIVFYYTLKKLINNSENVFWITAFFALIPYNETKILMVSLPYTIGFFLVFMATYCFVVFVEKRGIILRVLSLVLYFISFAFLNSTLVLMLGFILFMAVYTNYKKSEKPHLRMVIAKLLSWADFIILPFVYWICRSLFLKPAGIYSIGHYNTITIGNLALFPKNLLLTIDKSIFGVVYETFGAIYSTEYLFVFFVVLSLLLIYYIRTVPVKDEHVTSKIWLVAGVYFFILGSFAYLMVGKIPSFFSYDTRHQILLRICMPLLLLAYLGIVKSDRVRKNVAVIILALFVVTSIGQNIKYLASWLKQVALERNFSASTEIKKNDGLEVVDNTREINENENEYAFYCYNGILKKAFNDQSHFMISTDYLQQLREKVALKNFTQLDNYNMKSYKGTWDLNGYVLIDYNKGEQPSIKVILSLLADYYFSRAKFDSQISKYITIKYLAKK